MGVALAGQIRSKGTGKLAKESVKIRFAEAQTFEFSAASAPAGVGGNSGVGKVTAVGDGVSGLKEGDMVVPVHSGLGMCPSYRMHHFALQKRWNAGEGDSGD